MKEEMTGEFMRVAEELAKRICDADGVTIDDLTDIFRDSGGFGNLYPSNTKGSCQPVAFFVSLSVNKNGRGHLNFSEMIACFVQHMQGHCPGVTRHAVMITDSWDAIVFDDWRANVERVKLDASVEVYMIKGKSVMPVPI